MGTSLAERFWSKVDKDNGPIHEQLGKCWQWTAAKCSGGYGMIHVSGKTRERAYRLSWMLAKGEPVSSGMELDHLCRNRACVNPDHLEAVTHTENVRRGYAGRHWAAKTHCPRGHEYTGYNVILSRKGSRNCRKCLNLRNADYMRRKRAEQRDGSA